MEITTPVFFDIFLFYGYMSAGYKMRLTYKFGLAGIIVLAFVSSVIVMVMPQLPFIQIIVYLMIMPVLLCFFSGNITMKVVSYLKILLTFTIINLVSVQILGYADYINNTFILFITFSILVRIAAYMILKKSANKGNINYFDISNYKYIIIKAIMTIVLLIANSYVALNEETSKYQGTFFLNSRNILLVVLIVLVINMFEDVEKEAGIIIHGIIKYQQEVVERNYLDVITERTQELAKIRHDIKDHIFMVRYLAGKEDLKGIKDYLKKISIVEGEAVITVPQKEWLGALIYSKVEKVKKDAIFIDFQNNWRSNLFIEISDMDLLSLFSNLIDNSIEALKKVQTNNEKLIRLSLGEKKGYLLIDSSNAYSKEQMNIVNGELKTRKNDKDLHGKGTKIIQDIVKRYSGVFEYRIEKEIFLIQITLRNQKR